MEQPDRSPPFRWLVGLSVDGRVRDATVSSKYRGRPVAGRMAARFLPALMRSSCRTSSAR